MHTRSKARWPKPVLQLSEEELRLKREWLLGYTEWGYSGFLGWFQRQAHVEIERLSRRPQASAVTLEVGCGQGYHARFVSGGTYIGLEINREHLEIAKQSFPHLRPVHGDAYELPFRSACFDRVVSVYAFEHLHNLPASLAEIRRVLKPDGELLVGLPAEGGLAHNLGRRLTTKRQFERNYGRDFLRLARAEHCNTFQDVLDELRDWFRVETVRYLPFLVPSVHLNAVVALRCVKGPP